MAIFNSYVSLPEGSRFFKCPAWGQRLWHGHALCSGTWRLPGGTLPDLENGHWDWMELLSFHVFWWLMLSILAHVWSIWVLQNTYQLVDGWETSTSLAHSLKSGKNARVSLDDILIWHNILGCTMNREEEKGQFLRISSFAVQEDHNPCIDHGRSCSCSTEQIPTPSATTRWSENSRENPKIHWFLLIGLTQIVIVVRSSYPAKFRFHHPNCYIDLF